MDAMTPHDHLPRGVQSGSIQKKAFPTIAEGERFETILAGREWLIETISSAGHTTRAGEWYDQERDEWVLLMEGEATIAFEGGAQKNLHGGDWVYLPAHCKHRVVSTSARPGCTWLAVHLTPARRS
jgi:cupin 2 domain-containing protein